MFIAMMPTMGYKTRGAGPLAAPSKWSKRIEPVHRKKELTFSSIKDDFMDVNTLLFTLPKWRGMSAKPFDPHLFNLPAGEPYSSENRVVGLDRFGMPIV